MTSISRARTDFNDEMDALGTPITHQSALAYAEKRAASFIVSASMILYHVSRRGPKGHSCLLSIGNVLATSSSQSAVALSVHCSVTLLPGEGMLCGRVRMRPDGVSRGE